MKTIKPAKDYLFCKQEDKEQVTKSGLLISSNAAERPKVAEVINTGTNVDDYSQHDQIIYKDYTTQELKLDGVEYFLIHKDDVLGHLLENNNG